jgi:hypothetical protein
MLDSEDCAILVETLGGKAGEIDRGRDGEVMDCSPGLRYH